MIPYLSVQDIGKSFGATRANHRVSFTVGLGEVVALVGENGAGKSTLVKMLTGIYQPDSGKIQAEGHTIHLSSPQDAWNAGITAIHQETVMFDELSVAENLFMGQAPVKRSFFAGGLIQWKTMLEKSRTVLQKLDAKFTPETPLKDLSVAQKHLVQIARALVQDAKIVIMDEPTAALSRAEIEDLYRIVRQLKEEGKGILLITHKFDEIFELSDRYVVLRDGEKVADGNIQDVTSDDLIRLMAGRDVGSLYPKKDVIPGEVVLEVKNLSHPTEFSGISFQLRKGEILGFYGLIGAGRSEAMQALFGLSPHARGEVKLLGKKLWAKSPADALKAGLVYVPEDRQVSGAILPMSIVHNITLPSLPRLGFFLNRRRELQLAQEYSSRLSLKAAHLDQHVSELSGGNQQKVVISKWLATQPAVIILDEPTKGIDVGAKAAVHSFMGELVEKGLSVILVSSELPEVMHLADRILVMREGKVVGEVNAKTAQAHEIVKLAAGVADGEVA
ncbi:sugar ABC transporter ATP-binding protein [Deinococcus roseus]|uniref:Ribose import ATP-binding protein RbsA n=1 Tax=Deinococcus roseus TaxID=392414 RepID=A0ABQ2D472_9DEIO|nr:sugar ABC transporter ATP-binding protein [Deinococcus roseus]GGJ42519.1 ribose import ATP-binding protein RbsA [Deinococcus roseus]